MKIIRIKISRRGEEIAAQRILYGDDEQAGGPDDGERRRRADGRSLLPLEEDDYTATEDLSRDEESKCSSTTKNRPTMTEQLKSDSIGAARTKKTKNDRIKLGRTAVAFKRKHMKKKRRKPSPSRGNA